MTIRISIKYCKANIVAISKVLQIHFVKGEKISKQNKAAHQNNCVKFETLGEEGLGFQKVIWEKVEMSISVPDQFLPHEFLYVHMYTYGQLSLPSPVGQWGLLSRH